MSRIDPSRRIHLHCFDLWRDAAVACLTTLGFDQDKIMHESTITSIKKGDYYAVILPSEKLYSLTLGVVTLVRIHEMGHNTIETDGLGFTQPIACSLRQ